MRKRYNVSLDPEVVEMVNDHLVKMNMTFSGFLNAILAGFVQEMEGKPLLPNKPLKELTLEELGKFLNHWTVV